VWYGCPHCGHPIPVVPWRERPPLFSWEVFPHLYPPLPAPRIPSRSLPKLLSTLLVAGTVALAVLAGTLAVEGAVALAPGSFTVAGRVLAEPTAQTAAHPISGARLTLISEGSLPRTTVSAADGTFQILGVEPGGLTLNASAPGYRSQSRVLFLSAVYETSGSASDPAVFNLSLATNSSNQATASAVIETPFPDLEGFVATLWSSSALLLLGTIVSAAGAVALFRRRRPGLGVAGGAAGVMAPVALLILEVNAAFPWVGAWAAVTIGFGATVVGIQSVRMALVGLPLEPE
jgi:hypothetical protein